MDLNERIAAAQTTIETLTLAVIDTENKIVDSTDTLTTRQLLSELHELHNRVLAAHEQKYDLVMNGSDKPASDSRWKKFFHKK